MVELQDISIILQSSCMFKVTAFLNCFKKMIDRTFHNLKIFSLSTILKYWVVTWHLNIIKVDVIISTNMKKPFKWETGTAEYIPIYEIGWTLSIAFLQSIMVLVIFRTAATTVYQSGSSHTGCHGWYVAMEELRDM